MPNTGKRTVHQKNSTSKEQYIKRHDRVYAQLHFNICKKTGV